MNAAPAAAGFVVALVGALAYLVVCDLFSQEIRARLFRLPFLFLRLAARRLPPDQRADIYEETWLPDLHYILRDEEAGPLTRLARATGHALSLWLRRGGVQMAEALAAVTPVRLDGFEDVRALPPGRRREFAALTARLREQLERPADPDTAVGLLTAAVTACEACIDDRDEHTAKELAVAARPLAHSLDPGHPAVLGIRRAHAHALLQLGRFRRAEALLRELGADEVRIFGPGAPETFRTRRLLGWALVGEGRFAEAEARLRSLAAQVPADELPLRLHIECMLSWTMACQGRRDEAEDAYDSVIAFRSRELGAGHPDTLDARHSQGKMLVRSGDAAGAQAVLRPLLADRARILGRRHPDTLETRKYLAVARALASPGRSGLAHRGAVRELRRVARAQTRRHGPGHLNTEDTRQWLATLTGSAAGR
ncbi:tetratricopeptide repeat protein [Streptomyces sp. NPDC020490]|uniref:tetratricopeptide repeat protein n=1 Tax=Streptomyces sp. NPDC020490 TaxID=3365078 RepID=UPI0037B9858F